MIWNLSQYGDHTALIQGDETVTYRQLNEMADAIAKKIPGRTLAFILSSNSVGSIAGYVGLVNHEIVPLLLDAQINAELLRNLIDTYLPSYLWVPDEKKDAFADYTPVFDCAGYSLLQAVNDPGTELFPELGVLISTSGSTGSPKLVRQTYTNIEENTRSIIQYLQITDQERAITTLPMNYVYGLSVVRY